MGVLKATELYTKTVKKVKTDFMFTSILPHTQKSAQGLKPVAAAVFWVPGCPPSLALPVNMCLSFTASSNGGSCKVPSLTGHLTAILPSLHSLWRSYSHNFHRQHEVFLQRWRPEPSTLHHLPQPAQSWDFVFGDKCPSLHLFFPPRTFSFSCPAHD